MICPPNFPLFSVFQSIQSLGAGSSKEKGRKCIRRQRKNISTSISPQPGPWSSSCFSSWRNIELFTSTRVSQGKSLCSYLDAQNVTVMAKQLELSMMRNSLLWHTYCPFSNSVLEYIKCSVYLTCNVHLFLSLSFIIPLKVTTMESNLHYFVFGACPWALGTVLN